MKVNGVTVTSCEELLVLPRSSGENIVFRAIAVSINDEFNRIVAMPVPPMVLVKGGKKEPDLTDTSYKMACSVRDDQRFAYMVLKSLEPSNIEWDTIDMEKPKTWVGWDDEMKKDGLSDVEVNRVVSTVMAANALDEKKIAEARRDFLRGQEA